MAFEWGDFSEKAFHSIIESNSRLNIWEGSVRSSKTISSIVRWLNYVSHGPEGLLLMVGKTNKTLERNILYPLAEMLSPSEYHYSSGKGMVTIFGREIDVVGANDETSQEKIRGATVAGAYCDEIALYPESFFVMLLSRMSVVGAKLFGTTNPDSPYHWLKTNYLDRENEEGINLSRFHFTIDDNPNLDPEYVKAIKAEYTGLWYKRFILGLWVLAEGTIYDMWDEKKHVVDVKKDILKERKRFKKYTLSIDYGTSNPFAAGLFGYDGNLPVYLEKEYHYDGRRAGRQKTDSQYADDLVKWLDGLIPDRVYIDPSAASFITELKQRKGFGSRVYPAQNDVLDGIRFVGNCLGGGQFKVDKSCTETIKEFSSYIWDEKAQAKGEDKPIKDHDHHMDKIRYDLFSHFYRANPQILFGLNMK